MQRLRRLTTITIEEAAMLNKRRLRHGGTAVALSVLLMGCQTSSSGQLALYEVAADVESRTGKRIDWDADQYADPLVRSTIEGLMAHPLTPDSAVQIALLNNRELIATYAEIGIAQAGLVQAGLFPNPIVDGSVRFIEGGGAPNFTFDLALRAAEVLYMPLRKRLAEAELEEAKLGVTAQILAVAGETHVAFLDYLGEKQLADVYAHAAEASRASVEAAKALRQAGNITALDYETEAAQQVQAEADSVRAQTRVAEARERLNRLMGLTGYQTQWQAAARLPDVPARELPTENAEARAIEANVSLAAARQRILTLGRKYRVERATALVPALDLGVEWEREDGEHAVGPAFGAQVPLFDWGQARKQTARMEILRAQDQYTAIAVRVRSAARLQRSKLLTARKTALFYADTALPQAQRLLQEAERQHNAMQIGVFRLLDAKRQQLRTAERYVEALAAYWKERARFGLIMRGGLLEDGDRAPRQRVSARDAGTSANQGGH